MKATLIAAMLGLVMGTIGYKPVETEGFPLVPVLLFSAAIFTFLYWLTYLLAPYLKSKTQFGYIGVFPGLMSGVNLSNISGAMLNDANYSIFSAHGLGCLAVGVALLGSVLAALYRIRAAQPNNSLKADGSDGPKH